MTLSKDDEGSLLLDNQGTVFSCHLINASLNRTHLCVHCIVVSVSKNDDRISIFPRNNYTFTIKGEYISDGEITPKYNIKEILHAEDYPEYYV